MRATAGFSLPFALLGLALLAGDAGPAGERIRLPVSRDTVVSAAPGERDANLGGARWLKTKGTVELTLFDVDASRLRGRIIESASLHLLSSSPDRLRRATVSTVAAEWSEGDSTGYRSQRGSASFAWAAQGQRAWAYRGSDVTAAINGRGNTTWWFAEASPADSEGWQTIPVHPSVVAARAAGISHGFALSDDVGNEYSRDGDRFAYRFFPNRLFWSREAGASKAPFLTVVLGGEDRQPPPAVELEAPSVVEPSQLRPGEALARWRTPVDPGGAGVVGFEARVSQADDFVWSRAVPIPRHLVPAPGPPGHRATLHLRDLELAPGASALLGVRAIDGAGNAGPVTIARVDLAPDRPSPALAAPPEPPHMPLAVNPEVGGLEVYVVDPLDKVRPVSGEMIPARVDHYRRRNHLWSAAERRVRLYAARNEFVAFQVVLAGASRDVRVRLEMERREGSEAPRARLYRFAHVPTRLGPLPDPLVPLPASGGLAATGGAGRFGFQAVLADVYVPHDSKPGVARGSLVVEAGDRRLEIDVRLRIWAFTLPDHLSFIPQMNALQPPSAELGASHYRLAHEHRTCLNRLPYGWRGEVHPDYALPVKGAGFDWQRFDRRFGSLLDGSAFADLPRAGVPVEAFYLPLNENWPVPVDEGFRGGYWADLALGDDYRRRFVDASRRFAAHLQQRRWTETFFEFYLNNKIYYKKDDWRRSTAPWILDEPVNTQDFWALRWFGRAFHEGVYAALGGAAEPRAKLGFRCDVSGPQWRRDLLDGLLDIHVVGAGFTAYQRWVLEGKRRLGEIVYHYGTTNEIEASNVQAAAWCLRTWSLGGDGVLPWQSMGRPMDWEKGSALALFYPPVRGLEDPVPSIRLKAYRRGQQDVEYLVQLSRVLGLPRWVLGEEALRRLDLGGSLERSSPEDAGTLDFAAVDPADLWRLRTAVGARLDRLAPPARRRWVELRSPQRNPARLPRRRFLVEDRARP